MFRPAIPQCQRAARRFSTGSSRPRWASGEKYWAIASLAIALPATYYIYQSRQPKPPAGAAQIAAKQHGGQPVTLPDRTVLLPSLSAAGIIEQPGAGHGPVRAAATPRRLAAQYLLVGGGLASFAAMEAILEADAQADILIVSDEAYPPYMRPPLSKELWYVHEPAAQAEAFEYADWHGQRRPVFFHDLSFYETEAVDTPQPGRVRLLLGKRAVSLDQPSKTVLLQDGTAVGFGKALIATGSSPRLLDCIDTTVHQVSTLRRLEDFTRIKEAAQTAQSLAIIGGGFVGSELACALAAFSSVERGPDRPLRITQIFPEAGNMGLVFPRYLSAWTTAQLRALGIDVWPDSQIAAVSARADGRVEITTQTSVDGQDTTRSLLADHVVVAIGAQPNVQLAQSGSLDVDTRSPCSGGLRVDATLQASPDIYAAGDVISFPDAALGLSRHVEHYDHAHASGRLAGYNMACGRAPEAYSAPSMFWSDLGPQIGYEAVGLVDSTLTTVGVWAKAAASDTPQQAALDPSDIRTAPIGQTSSSSEEAPPGAVAQAATLPTDYRKGLVLYLKDRVVVGVLMFNLFNRVALAKSLIQQRASVDSLQDIVDLFNVNDL